MNGKLAAALEYASKGIPVLPLCWPTPDGRCGCGRGHQGREVGKAPLTRRAHLDATVDDGLIWFWWATWPEANLGIALEPAGLMSIAPDSEEWLREFELWGLPEGAAVFESGGGPGHRHYLLHRPEGCPASRLCRPEEFDILSKGYVVVPPSRHRSGSNYRWLRPLYELGFLPDAPAWAVRMLLDQAERARPIALPVREDEPPVRLDDEGLEWWRGERMKTLEDGRVDRSATLYAIGYRLALGGAGFRTIVDALRDRDSALGLRKYVDRRDGGEKEYERIADKVLAAVEGHEHEGRRSTRHPSVGLDVTRPLIMLAPGGYDLAEVVDRAWSALVSSGLPIYRQGGVGVEVTGDPPRA